MGNIKLFESKQIRSVWNEADEKWYFVVEDVVFFWRRSSEGRPVSTKSPGLRPVS